jgi:hypothetical protein
LYVTNAVPTQQIGTPGALGVFDLPSLTFSHWIDISSVCTDAVGITIDPSDAYAYVTGETSGSLTQVDLSSDAIVGNLTGLGVGTVGSCIDPAGTYAYVIDSNGNGVNQVDVSTMTIVNTVYVYTVSTAIAMDPSGNAVWFFFGGSSFANIALPAFATYTPYAVSGTPQMSAFPGAIKLNNAGTVAFACEDSANHLWRIDTSSHVVSGPTLMGSPSGHLSDIAINATDTTALIGQSAAPAVNLLDLSSYVNAYTLMVLGTDFTIGTDIGPYGASATTQIVMLV